MRTPLRAARRTTLAALLALASVTCTDQPTEPGMGHSARVLFAPTFAGSFAAGLPLDNVTVTVVRPAAETLAVVNAPFATGDSTLQIDVQVDLLAVSESLEVTLDLRSGVSNLFHGSRMVLVTSGVAGTPPTIPLTYVGPGANIAFLFITPNDSVLSFGDTLTFGADAYDNFEASVPNFYLSWSTGTPGVAIRSDGRLIAPSARASVWIRAITPTGIADSTRITFVPVPTQLTKATGDLQNGAAGDTLALPLTVLVRAADALPVMGVPVTFQVTTGGGHVVDSLVFTDSLGRASTSALLGPGAGSNSYSATVAGVGSVTFGATGGAGAPSAIAKQGGDAQSDTAGRALAPFIARVTDANSNPVAGVAVAWSVVRGTGTLAADTVLTDANGEAAVIYTLGVPGADTIRARIAGTGAFADFTATAVAGAIQVVVVAGDSQVATVAQALTDSLVVETQSLGAGAPVGGVPVVWTVQAGNATLSADTVVSDSLGRAAVALTFGTVAGEVEVRADAARGGPLGVFHLKAAAAAPHHLVIAVAPNDTIVSGTFLAPPPVIEVRDSFENVVPQAGIVIHAYTDGMLPAAPLQLSAPAGLQMAGYVGGRDSAVTDTTGRATFDSLLVGGEVGDETLHFEDSGLGLMIAIPIHLLPGAPTSLIAIAGAGQTAYIESLVTVPPRVVVSDSFGNTIAGVAVEWAIVSGGGQITGASGVTDSLGEAAVGSWRMGPSPVTNVLRAVVAGVDSVEFQATAIPLTPSIELTLLSTNVVGVGRTATLKVALSRPDSLGTIVSLTNLNSSVVTLDSASASFGPVDTARFRVLTGVAAGTADIIASAPGYLPDTITVTGSLNLITLPTTQNVAFGQTASLPVQLALPAPAGGVVVNVTSLDPSRVSVVTPTVSFSAGEQLKNATVSGVALGTAQVVAENPNFAPDTSLVSTTATLNITATSVTAFSTFGAQITTEFRSNGVLTPTPTGGITVTYTSQNPACVSAPATTLIPQGQTTKSDSIGYGGSASLPCTTYLVATAPGIDPDSVQVTINPPPAATFNFATTEVGSGLQYGSFNVNLAVSAHGGRNVTVRTLDPAKVLIQPNSSTAGTDSMVQFLPNTQTSISFWLAGVEGIVNDSALVVTTVPGFAPDTGKVYIRQGMYELTNVPGNVNYLSGNSAFWVQMGVPNAAFTTINANQGVRVGGTLGRIATVTLNSSTVAQLVDTSAVVDSVKNVTFQVGQYYTPTSVASGGLAIDPIGVGTVTATASVPGLIALPTATRTMTVNPAVLSTSSAIAEVGAGLQYGTYNVNLSGPNHGGTTIKLRVTQPGVGFVQPDANTAGTDSINLVIPNGQTSGSFWIAGAEGILNDTVPVIAEAPGFISDTMLLVVRQPAIEIANVPGSIGSLAASQAIWAQIGLPNVALTTMNLSQGPRVGGTIGRTPTVIITPGDVALLRDSTTIADSSKTVTIPIGQYYSPTSVASGGLAIDPITPGTATVSVSLAGFAPLPTAVRTMTVTGPTLSLPTSAEVGSGLQYGTYTANLSASGHGGVTLKLRTLTPGVAVLQPNGTTVGTDSLMVPIPNGTGSYGFWVAGLEGVVSDSVLVVAEIPGFVPDTMKVYVRRPAFELTSVPTSTTTLSPNTNIWVQMGVPNAAGTTINAPQGSRSGGTAPTFYVRSNAPTVVRIVDSTSFGDSLPITLPAGLYYSPTSVASGGLGVDPLTTGTTNIVVTHPFFTPMSGATRPITVATPGISVSGGVVGSGLQKQVSFNLGAPQHGGVDVVVKSTAPSVLKVSPDAITPGTDSIIVHINNGSTGGNFYIQGMEGQTGAPTIQVSAPGFTDGSAGATVVQPAIEVTQVPTTPSSGAANTVIWAQVGVANGTYTSMNENQNIRAGGADSVFVTFTNSNGAAAQLSTQSLTGNTVTAPIILGRYYTPTGFAQGGVVFDPLAPGSTQVAVSLAGFVALPAATVNVNVGP